MTDNTFKPFDVAGAMSEKPKTTSVTIPKSAKKAIPKTVTNDELDTAITVGKKRGFVERSVTEIIERRAPGRPKSIYTAQLHTRVKQETLDLIIENSIQQGSVYGKIVEDAFLLYRKYKHEL